MLREKSQSDQAFSWHLGAFVEPSWRRLVPWGCLEHLGPSWGALGRFAPPNRGGGAARSMSLYESLVSLLMHRSVSWAVLMFPRGVHFAQRAPSETHLPRFRGVFGSFLGRFLGYVLAFGGVLGRFLGYVLGLGNALGASLGAFWVVLERLGVVLEASWGVLGASWTSGNMAPPMENLPVMFSLA